MTDKERKDYVLGTYLKCTKPITNIRKGRTGCKVGESYWFEYIYTTPVMTMSIQMQSLTIVS